MGHKRRCQKRVTAAVDPILKFSTGAFSFAFAMESIAIASPRMVAGGMVDGGMGWWLVDGPIKRLLSPPKGRRPRAQWPI